MLSIKLMFFESYLFLFRSVGHLSSILHVHIEISEYKREADHLNFKQFLFVGGLDFMTNRMINGVDLMTYGHKNERNNKKTNLFLSILSFQFNQLLGTR